MSTKDPTHVTAIERIVTCLSDADEQAHLQGIVVGEWSQ